MATATWQGMEELINETLTCGCRHLLLFDYQSAGDALTAKDSSVEIRNRLHSLHPDEHMLQFAPPADFNFTIASYQAGAKAVIPRPRTDGEGDGFVAELALLLEMLPSYLLINSV
jgi:hypothetical protein